MYVKLTISGVNLSKTHCLINSTCYYQPLPLTRFNLEKENGHALFQFLFDILIHSRLNKMGTVVSGRDDLGQCVTICCQAAWEGVLGHPH